MGLNTLITISCLALTLSFGQVFADSNKTPEKIDISETVNELYNEAYQLIDQNNREAFLDARKKLEQLIELDPDFPRAYLELARLEMKTRWPEGLHKAEKQILIAKSIDSNLADTNILLGYVYTNLRRFSEAESLYKEAEKVGSDNLWLYANWGLNYEFQLKFEEAISRYYKVLDSPVRRVGKNVRPLEWVYQYSMLYSMLTELGRMEEADELYTRNAKEFPERICKGIRQAKHRLYNMDNVQLALTSIKAVRQRGCEKGKDILSIAHYMEWFELKEQDKGNKAAAIALRKAQAFAPEDNELILALLKSGKTAQLISKIPDLDINYHDGSGNTALSNAVSRSAWNDLEALLEIGADPNIETNDDTIMSNPLVIATLKKSVSMVEILLKHGADPHQVIRNEYTIADLIKDNGLESRLSEKIGG